MNSFCLRLGDNGDDPFPPGAEREEFLSRLISRLPPGAHPVELVCGTGDTPRAMADAGSVEFSFDVDPGMIAFSRDLPWPAGVFENVPTNRAENR